MKEGERGDEGRRETEKFSGGGQEWIVFKRGKMGERGGRQVREERGKMGIQKKIGQLLSKDVEKVE